MDKLVVVLMLAFALAMPLSCALAADEGPKVGDKITDFELKDLDGKAVKTADMRKDKVVLLKFGATWCGWCNKEVPHLNQVQKEYGDKVALLDIDVKETAEKVAAHNKKMETTYKTVLDPDGAVAKKYGVSGIPVVIIADKDGKIAYRGYYTKYEDLKKVIDGLLKDAK